MKFIKILLLLFCAHNLFAQTNPLFIPPTLTGTTFNLNVQNGTTQFWNGITTNTYGINGNILAPTIIVNKGDSITLNVTNNLSGAGNATTMHWHGLHVAPQYDGGPHQVISQGSTWSPSFKILNDAGTYWYHPHGDNKTDRHVSKGLAGMLIVKDATEGALTLPRTYGIDDFPIILQTKEFDILNQIAIATFFDTVTMVNATRNPFVNLPSQIVRLRLLNGASQRTFMVGFSNNMNFQLIGNDDGLLDVPQTTNRLLLSNGERAEILLDLTNNLNDTLFLESFGSELPKGIFGADSVGDAGVNQITDYYLNPLNGTDFNFLQINVIPQTATPITTIPTTLIPQTSLMPDANTIYRHFEIDTIGGMGITPNYANGPFAFNQKLFKMDSINEKIILNSKEIWTIHNKTMVAHPFHIHDVTFNVLDINGIPPPAYIKGKKDVVLVMPGDSVRFITEFKDFSNDTVPYMYHCHVLHHEDDGMMGSFIVTKFPLSINNFQKNNSFAIYPNPANTIWHITNIQNEKIISYQLYDVMGKLIEEKQINNAQFNINNAILINGNYLLKLNTNHNSQTFTIIKN
jgi:blue copper oxidase